MNKENKIDDDPGYSPQPLWTRDFTILTLGTIISMLGNAISGFAIGLLVLDYTGSIFLYALFAVVYSLPKIVMPIIAGPYIDRFSRKKIIYTLDFISAALYLGFYFIISTGSFNYPLFLLICIIIGSIDSIYQVAYDSFYPTLIGKGNYTKAYSISSMIYPLAAIMVPVAAYCYENVGLEPLFIFNALTFLIAAIFETQIKAKDTHIDSTNTNNNNNNKYNLRQYAEDFKNGLSYISAEKGLLVITGYFFVSALIGGVSGTLILPYFKSEPSLGVIWYTYIMGCAIFGRLIGGAVHYKFKYPTNKKFAIALFVYIIAAAIEGTYLFMPIAIMMLMNFLSGMLCVTSYNIRISSTQNYVPNELRGRFNGTFQMIFTLGGILGQLIAGVLGEFLPIRPIILISSLICIFAAILIMYRGRRHVKLIYNRSA
ncbi:MFS transporter [Clostridium sp.]|uniref:MFS transporter n=1 Tax=Clostridium sp. TaxID=1506 RepID=UPI003217F299